MFDWKAYLPTVLPGPVVGKGEFRFSAVGLDHGHIYDICDGLLRAGAELVSVFDQDREKAEAFVDAFPGVRIAAAEDEVLGDPSVQLVASAIVPSARCDLGIRVMQAGKDYLVDKAPMTTLDQLARAREAASRTGRKYIVFYGERLSSEAGMYVGTLLEDNVIGRVLQVMGLGPHRLDAPNRPTWFFQREAAGGILCDLASHQAEQFLYYTKAKDALVTCSQVANFAHPQYPEFEDFGDAMFAADNGATMYLRVDWFTPAGLSTWGDIRTFILGTEGYLEMRKTLDVGSSRATENILLVNGQGEYKFSVSGRVGIPFHGQVILDCLNRTENAVGQAHAFKAAELCLKAQAGATRIGG